MRGGFASSEDWTDTAVFYVTSPDTLLLGNVAAGWFDLMLLNFYLAILDQIKISFGKSQPNLNLFGRV